MVCNLNSTMKCGNAHCNCRRSSKIKYIRRVKKRCFKRGALRKRCVKKNCCKRKQLRKRSNITNH